MQINFKSSVYELTDLIALLPQEFIVNYEAALRTQNWQNISPLIHKNAKIIFSNGSVHKGKEAVRIAFEKNFETIKNEDYNITNVHLLHQSETSTVYTFNYNWSGFIHGKRCSGKGLGSCVLILDQGIWKLILEHLSSIPKN